MTPTLPTNLTHPLLCDFIPQNSGWCPSRWTRLTINISTIKRNKPSDFKRFQFAFFVHVLEESKGRRKLLQQLPRDARDANGFAVVLLHRQVVSHSAVPTVPTVLCWTNSSTPMGGRQFHSMNECVSTIIRGIWYIPTYLGFKSLGYTQTIEI